MDEDNSSVHNGSQKTIPQDSSFEEKLNKFFSLNLHIFLEDWRIWRKKTLNLLVVVLAQTGLLDNP